MSIDPAGEERGVRRPRRKRWGAALLGAGLVLVGPACGGDANPPAAETASPPAATVPAAPAAEVPARPATVAELFPAGDGRELVLNTCANCHAVACAAMGQRTDARWREIEAAHREHVPGLSDADRSRIFDYLRMHFNDSRPEPEIPAEFLDRGCTPF